MSIQAERDYNIIQVAAIVAQGKSIALAVLAFDFYINLLDCASDPQTNSLWYKISTIHKITQVATHSRRIN